MSRTVNSEFILTQELHKTIIQSLASSFALDFLLFEDKKGGDVDTIHNARAYYSGDNEINISDKLKTTYNNKEKYDSHKYHSDQDYINRGKTDKKLYQEGRLYDSYRGQNMAANDKRQLDHIISASEIDKDAGRILSGLNGVDLANQSSNFQSTHGYINNLKNDYPIDKFLDQVVPQTIQKKQESINKKSAKLDSMPNSNPQQRHERQKLEDKIKKEKEHIEALESIDPEKMRDADRKARTEYDRQINIAYYTGSEFLSNTAKASLHSGLKMGTRQVLGVIVAEFWFELKEQIPFFYQDMKTKFELKAFIQRISSLFKNTWEKVKTRFKEILAQFKDGVLTGVLSSLTSTFMNIFMTTTKVMGKLIREMWSSIVSAAKLMFFNPDKLAIGNLTREVIRVLSLGLSVIIGSLVSQQLSTLLTIPFGTELSAFASALTTGLLTLGMTYFLDHSEMMGKVWDFLNQFKSESKMTLEYYQKVNKALDSYLARLAQIELNMNTIELASFSNKLESTNYEFERSLILKEEVKKRSIELPFDLDNLDSTRNWLSGLKF